MNFLEEYFQNNEGRLIHKWMHYFEIYDRYFSKYRGQELTIVEFGVSQGGSLQMWKKYFGPKARIIGVDINPHCKKLEEDQISIFIGDQEDRTFLKYLSREIGTMDILLDDGGHTMKQQIATFEELYDFVKPDGIYLCEDCHTSYWKRYEGGLKKKGTYIEYTKNFVDSLHAWHSENPKRFSLDRISKSAFGVHFYDSIVVVEKRPIKEPTHYTKGYEEIPYYETPLTYLETLQKKVAYKLNKLIK